MRSMLKFAFRFIKNDGHRVTAKCKAEGCPWSIHASKGSATQLISIKTMNPTHTCRGAAVSSGPQATGSWAWRGKESAQEHLQGSHKDAYSQLPSLCDRIMETNPGSLATFTTKEDSSFHRLSISFHATLSGFVQGCRPLLFLDSIPLKSKYQGTLLTATAADGDDDRQNGLQEPICEIFKGSYHGYCLRCIAEQLVRDLKGQCSQEVKRIVIEDLHHADFAPNPEDFNASVERIKKN
ncbi:uncharacterized protein LOC120193148 [Hibiscus syriacus]|uniref:uncharacterized protein LOC120193148 n=1 Tax=Hibiscus syriacus TaxID=106335 RepID=UPI001920D1E6|nr:uncharacterized protein LOC120193148 [Hibiscus syriacus]